MCGFDSFCVVILWCCAHQYDSMTITSDSCIDAIGCSVRPRNCMQPWCHLRLAPVQHHCDVVHLFRPSRIGEDVHITSITSHHSETFPVNQFICVAICLCCSCDHLSCAHMFASDVCLCICGAHLNASRFVRIKVC